MLYVTLVFSLMHVVPCIMYRLANSQSLLVDKKFNHSFKVYNEMAARKARINELKLLCQLDPTGPHKEELKSLLLDKYVPPVFDLTEETDEESFDRLSPQTRH